MKKIVPQSYYFGLIVAFLILPVVQHGHAANAADKSIINEGQDQNQRSLTKPPTRDTSIIVIYEERDRDIPKIISGLRGWREGFIFGIGAGVGFTNFTAPLAVYWAEAYEGSWPDPRQTRPTFATELKIGHGLSDQFLLYYTSRISWLPLSNLYRDTMIANGSAGAGMMYFPLRSIDFYFVSSLGLATLVTWHPPFKLEKARQTGLVASGGIGYEFLRHLTVDFTVNFGHANIIHFDDVTEIKFANEIITYLVTLNAIAY
ncbi:hypothetical protein J4G02_13220 [Candidatus Poribacteria bacterium]|nr:hypothetical protein [Candidatus Poribacteria bacterium]